MNGNLNFDDLFINNVSVSGKIISRIQLDKKYADRFVSYLDYW